MTDPAQPPFTFFAAGTPKTKGSMRSFQHPTTGAIITTNNNPKTKPWQGVVSTSAMVAGVRPIPSSVGVDVELRFYFLRPKKHFREVKPDRPVDDQGQPIPKLLPAKPNPAFAEAAGIELEEVADSPKRPKGIKKWLPREVNPAWQSFIDNPPPRWQLRDDAEPRPLGRQHGDLDKLERAVLDGLTGIAFADDSEVAGLYGSKHYLPTRDGVEGVHVTIREAEEEVGCLHRVIELRDGGLADRRCALGFGHPGDCFSGVA